MRRKNIARHHVQTEKSFCALIGGEKDIEPPQKRTEYLIADAVGIKRKGKAQGGYRIGGGLKRGKEVSE